MFKDLAGLQASFLKKDSITEAFQWFCKNSQKSYFTEHLIVPATEDGQFLMGTFNRGNRLRFIAKHNEIQKQYKK